MRKSILLTMLVVLALASSAYAYPVVVGSYNGLFFNNAEVLLDNDNSGTVSVGDTFWGTVQLNQIKDSGADLTGQTGPTIWSIGGGIAAPEEVTGYFATDIVGVIPPAIPGGDATIILGAAAVDPNGILAAGEVLRIYEDTEFDYNDSSQALALATATDGTLHSSLGMLGGGYWYTLAPVTPPGSGDVGESYAGLNYVIAPFQVAQVNDPNEGLVNSDVDMFFNSELGSLGNFGTDDADTLMHFSSNDPAVYQPIPEPTSMLLLGMGLAGLVLRKKKVA